MAGLEYLMKHMMMKFEKWCPPSQNQTSKWKIHNICSILSKMTLKTKRKHHLLKVATRINLVMFVLLNIRLYLPSSTKYSRKIS